MTMRTRRSTEQAILADPLRHDTARIRMMLQTHADATDSTVALKILANWADYRGKFVKVVPHDYRRALTESAERGKGGKAQSAACWLTDI